MRENIWNNQNLIKMLKENGVVVMPTDTIYGIVGKAESESVVNRIYAIRKRNLQKPCIILIGSVSELKKFSIILSKEQKSKIKKYWPGPVSVVFDCIDDLSMQAGKFRYLHRGTNTLAFRLPAQRGFQELLLKTGPLIAPSANIEGKFPAKDINEAKEYFGELVDLYIDGGEIEEKASKVVKLNNDGSVAVLRE